MSFKFDPVEFLNHIKLGNFSLSWNPLLSSCRSPDEKQGCYGRYGLGYGYEEHRKDIMNKYGINNSNFQLPQFGISLGFAMHSIEGYEYLYKFADYHNYPKPILNFRKVKGDLRPEMTEEFEKAVEENNKKKLLVDDLLRQLEEIASFSIEDLEITSFVDTDQFYNW